MLGWNKMSNYLEKINSSRIIRQSNNRMLCPINSVLLTSRGAIRGRSPPKQEMGFLKPKA
jgi:hypothetical protein